MTEKKDNIQEPQNNQNKIVSTLTRLVSLYADNVRLTTAEKLSVLVSSVAVITLSLVLIFIALIFVAIGVANLLEEVVPPYVSYFIIAGILCIMVVLLVLLREKLIVNPVARLMSRTFINPPKSK